jgi:hypothetical protein
VWPLSTAGAAAAATAVETGSGSAAPSPRHAHLSFTQTQAQSQVAQDESGSGSQAPHAPHEGQGGEKAEVDTVCKEGVRPTLPRTGSLRRDGSWRKKHAS